MSRDKFWSRDEVVSCQYRGCCGCPSCDSGHKCLHPQYRLSDDDRECCPEGCPIIKPIVPPEEMMSHAIVEALLWTWYDCTELEMVHDDREGSSFSVDEILEEFPHLSPKLDKALRERRDWFKKMKEVSSGS